MQVVEIAISKCDEILPTKLPPIAALSASPNVDHNEVTFDVQPMSDAEEEKEVKRLSDFPLLRRCSVTLTNRITYTIDRLFIGEYQLCMNIERLLSKRRCTPNEAGDCEE